MPDRLKVTYGRTINIGNFESVRIEVGMESDVRKDETSAEAFEQLEATVSSKLTELCAPFDKPTKKGK